MGKKTIDIRLRVKVEEGSAEEKLLAFLSDESAIPLKKSEMWLKAAKMCWLSLALEYKQCSQDEIEESLYDCDYSWELHWEFLLNKARKSLARVRHRVREIDLPFREADFKSGHGVGYTSDTGSNFAPLDNQYRNGNTSELSSNAKSNQNNNPIDEHSTVNSERNVRSYNLFGNSIISKQS